MWQKMAKAPGERKSFKTGVDRRCVRHLCSSHRLSRARAAGVRPSIQWSACSRRGARTQATGGDASVPVSPGVRRGPSPREPVTPPLPGSPRGENQKENNSGSMAWANQLWKQYDPINNIIFPKMGARPTYDDRGACATDVDRERDDPTHADEGTYENETTDSTLFEANNERRERNHLETTLPGTRQADRPLPLVPLKGPVDCYCR